MQDLVPIGRFSAMTRLSVKALRHYDDIGLLRPAHVDPDSAYRYYRLGQANRAEAIRALRSVDMPLDAIAAVLAADDDAQIAAVLKEHGQRVAAQLERHQRMLAYLERLSTGEIGLMPYTITVRHVPDQLVASVRHHTTLQDVGDLYGQAFSRIVEAMGRAGQAPAGAPLVIFHDVIDESTDGEIEFAVPAAGEVAETDGVSTRTLGGGSVARTVHRGPYEEITPAYHAVAAWAQEHGHEFAGPPREIYLSDPADVLPEELLTEVQWPIR